MTMNPQITAILIGVKDLDRSKLFYGEGLGCPIDKDYPQFVSFKLGDGSPEFGLYPREALAADPGVDPKGSGFTGVTFHYIVAASDAVDELIRQGERPGGTSPRRTPRVAHGAERSAAPQRAEPAHGRRRRC